MGESTPLERRATEILVGDLNRWLRGNDEPWREQEGYRTRLSNFALQVAAGIPDEAKRREVEGKIRAARAGDYDQMAAATEEALNEYIRNNPNANREAILSAMDNTMRIPLGGPATEGRDPRDYPLSTGEGMTFARLSREAETLARQQLEREERARPRPPETLLDELRRHRTTGIQAEQHNLADGNPNWAARYGESQAALLTGLNNNTNGSAIVTTLNREFELKARQPNTMLIASLNDSARTIDPSYVLNYYGQELRVNQGDTGQLDRTGTVALTLTQEDITQRRIRSVNIGEDGMTTVTLADGRSVRSPNNVVFRMRDDSGAEPAYYQMTAEQMRDWVVADQVRNPRVSLGSNVPRQPASQTQETYLG